MSLVVVVADSVRHDAFGCLGGAGTEVVDGLAASGVLFERAVTAAPWTVPSVASMLTGVYSHRLGLAKWEQPWPEHHPSLFERAARAGWEVASFVFDPSHLFRRVEAAGVCGSSQDTAGLLAWLRARRGSRFFLFVHYWWTHIPYVAKPMDITTWRQVTDQVLAAIRAGPESRAGVKRLYQHAVTQFSQEWLPRVLETLELDDTWVVVTSDHGESWGEREGVTVDDVFDLHGNGLYDEVLRVPLLVRPPGGGPARRVPELVRTVDLLPTLVELLGFDVPEPQEPLDGVSLARCVTGGEPPPALDAISVKSRDFVDHPTLPESPAELWSGFALTTRGRKLIWEPETNRRLAFDLVRDPGETVDVSGGAARELEPGWERLARELERARVGVWQEEDVKRVQDRLRRLGYID